MCDHADYSNFLINWQEQVCKQNHAERLYDRWNNKQTVNKKNCSIDSSITLST